ncbi:ABC transporter ATP-binding protein [Rhizosaccharibacter radicis]|uniref:ABC transporter ATP-binding protein n=1 Tax=Rhizosaccharibacter radicis TaxID=2782605 RepID=A0ABT1VUC8_9PROT|nr:ABC transporter ATP-binding protein [Acetobacteraceae bacterium KSS12]
MTATPGFPLLEVEALTISLPARGGGWTDLVRDVSFSLAPREILGLVGESGSGKSLTALALMGLVDAPGARITGSARYRGRELLGLKKREMQLLRGAEIAMIFQDPMTAFTPVYTVGAQIDEQIRAHRALSRAGARARTVEMLGEMGVPDPARAADRYPHQLSGGLRQRAMIAMALSCNPSLLIADEPTTALDVTVQAQILGLLRRLRRDYASAVLLITHDMGVVAETCDRTMVLYSGSIAESGPTDALFLQPGHPYTAGLLDSIPPLHGPRPRRLPAIPGAPPSPAQRPQGCSFRPRCAFNHAACLDPPPMLRRGRQDIACVLPAEGRDLPPRPMASFDAPVPA